MDDIEIPYLQYFASEMNKVQSNINDANKDVYESLNRLEKKRRELLHLHPNYDCEDEEFECVLSNIEIEMEYIQNEHDKVLYELEKQKQSLKKRLSSVEKLSLLTTALTHKIFLVQHEYQNQIKELTIVREEALNNENVSRAEKTKLINKVDKKIKELEKARADEVTALQNQRSSLQQQWAIKTQHMDVVMDSLKEQHHIILNELEESKINAPPSYITEANRRIEELNKMFDRDVTILHQLQSEGWKTKEERTLELLQSRGLCVTQSNKFLTSSGTHLTRSEATRLGLLEGINMGSWTNIFQEQLEGFESRPIHSETTISEADKMDNHDVLYLKTIFGKPLTLALAEITAKQPRDPIHYLGHWLFKYRYNQEISVTRKYEIQQLIQERERQEKEKLRMMYENEAKEAILNLILRAEEGAMQRELERIARDAMLLTSEDELAAEAKDTLGVYNGPTTGE